MRDLQWKQIYGRELLYSGPLFTHQLSHLWVDFRGIRDAYMRDHGSDYFENSRQATYVQQAYAIQNPLQFAGYGEHCWGFTACDGPGWVKRVVDGVERQFFDYIARGAPFGPDDGTVAPWVVVASLPFAPEIVIPTVRHLAGMKLGGQDRPYGFKPSFNQTFRVDDSPTGWWVTPYHFGIDQGPVVLMIENYRSGLIWDIMRRCPYLVAGLRRAGFTRRVAVADSRLNQALAVDSPKVEACMVWYPPEDVAQGYSSASQPHASVWASSRLVQSMLRARADVGALADLSGLGCNVTR